MINFKTYLLVARKYMGISIMYLGILFGITMALIANAKNNTTQGYETEKVEIAVYDKDESSLSKALYEYLEESQEIVELEENEDTWRDAMYTHAVEYILIIPEGFESEMQQDGDAEKLIAYETPGTTYAMFVEMKINRFIKTYLTYANLDKAPEECYELTMETLKEKVEVSLKDKEVATELPESYWYFKYIAYVLPCMMMLSVAPCIKAFKQKEIAKRTFCSSSSNIRRNLELTLGAIVHGGDMMLIMIVMGLVICEKMEPIQYVLYIGNALMHTLVGLGLAFALAHFDFNENLTNMFANIYSLASAFLCGVFVPREFLTDTILKIGHVFPAYWYLNLQEIVYCWTGSSEQISTAVMAILIQFGFAVAFLCVGFVVEKQKKM